MSALILVGLCARLVVLFLHAIVIVGRSVRRSIANILTDPIRLIATDFKILLSPILSAALSQDSRILISPSLLHL